MEEQQLALSPYFCLLSAAIDNAVLAARDIGVNSTALVKQLRLEGLIVTPKDTSGGIIVQTSLPESREAG